jgi:uncharacterized protein involved in exopolysaccharide biosynthesis
MISQPETGAAQCEPDDIDLIAVFRTLLAWWKLVLLFVLLGAIVAFVYSRMQPKEYTSTSVIYPQDSSGGGLAALMKDFPLAIGGSSTGGGDYLAALLKSDTLRLKVIHTLKLRDNPLFYGKGTPSFEDIVKTYSKRVVVSKDKLSGAISVSATVFDPRLAARIANEVVDDLGAMVITSSRVKSDFIEKKMNQTARLLNKAEEQTRDFQEANDIASLDDQTKVFITELGDLEGKILDIDAELRGVESRLANAGDPDQLVAMEVQKRSLLSSKATLDAKKQEMMAKVAKVPAVGLKYVRLQRKLAVLGKTYELLTQQYQLAQISQRGEYGDYQVIDRARPIFRKVAPRTGMNTVVGGMLGGVLAIVLVYAMTNRRTQSRTRRR